ncbi:MAG: methionyl-tRNA formyltransferase [Candidatus Nomurabacteria bacterium]|nr:methionyl-tRNA formyltransferase [Candidatus Nomurabacteria bacterium]
MNTNNYNFVFFGTPDVASETLSILKINGYTPTLIITSPDRPQGRKMLMTPSPTKVWAIENNIPYLQPEKLDTEFTLKLSTFNFRLAIVVAYGKILSEEIINIPKYGSINIHYSLLPKYRGASPVESAILNGDAETGIAIQKMVYKMDTGPIIAMEKVSINPDEHATELRKKLIKIGGELLIKTLNTTPTPYQGLQIQDETQATNCKKIKKEDGLLNEGDSEEQKYNKFRAYSLWPRTFFFKEGKRIIVTDAKLEDGKFVIKKVIPEGGKEQEYKN